MRTLWQSLPIVYKLFVSLLLSLTLVLGFISVYIWQYESTILIEKEQMHLRKILANKVNVLQDALDKKDKEAHFLSAIELMDDLIANDIDKRISQMLRHKADDLGQNIVLHVVRHQRIISSSQAQYINTPYTLPVTTYDERYFYFIAPIHASFDKSSLLGNVVLCYPLAELNVLLQMEEGKHLWLSPPRTHILFGEKAPSQTQHLVVSKSLKKKLTGWRLSLAYDKEKAFETISDIQNILFYALVLAFLLLIGAIWLISKGILQNIQRLSHTTEAVLKTKVYHKEPDTQQGEDEIEKLSHTFDALIKQTDTTQEALDAKTMFLSTISHELRTPLGSILTLTQHLMLDEKIGEENENMLGKIETSATHLLGMINNILEISKLETNRIIPHPQPTHLPTLLEEIYEMIEPLAEDKGLHLSKTIVLENEHTFLDQQLFKQVVINILSNAIKFTHQGRIELELRENTTHYLMSVSDTGVGIDKERLAYIFEIFYQSHVDFKQLKKSSGLGLALSKKIAQLLKGDLRIYSEGKDTGTTLYFTFYKS